MSKKILETKKKKFRVFFNILDFDQPQIMYNLGLVKIQNVEKKNAEFFPLSLEFFWYVELTSRNILKHPFSLVLHTSKKIIVIRRVDQKILEKKKT